MEWFWHRTDGAAGVQNRRTWVSRRCSVHPLEEHAIREFGRQLIIIIFSVKKIIIIR